MSVMTLSDHLAHKPDPKRVGSHCRIDCSCGWKGPQVPMFGQGHQPWVDHFKAVVHGMTAHDVPTGRTGEDSLDAERDHTSGAVPVGARSPHTTTCFSRLPGDNHCDCKARSEAWR